MRRSIVVVCMVACAVAGFAGLAAPAGARVESVSGVCKLITNIHITPSTDPTANGGKANAAKVSKLLSKAAKKTSGDLKNTLTTMANYFKSIARGDVNAIENQSQAFAAAAEKYVSYVASSCFGTSLPKGVTIPSIPNT